MAVAIIAIPPELNIDLGHLEVLGLGRNGANKQRGRHQHRSGQAPPARSPVGQFGDPVCKTPDNAKPMVMRAPISTQIAANRPLGVRLGSLILGTA